MFGFTESEALGKSLDIIIPQRQQQRHWDGYHQTMATSKTRYGNDMLRVPAVHKDGHGLSTPSRWPCCIRQTRKCQPLSR